MGFSGDRGGRMSRVGDPRSGAIRCLPDEMGMRGRVRNAPQDWFSVADLPLSPVRSWNSTRQGLSARLRHRWMLADEEPGKAVRPPRLRGSRVRCPQEIGGRKPQLAEPAKSHNRDDATERGAVPAPSQLPTGGRRFRLP